MYDSHNGQVSHPIRWAIVTVLAALLLTFSTSCSIPGRESNESIGERHLTLAGSASGPETLDPALVRDVESAFLARQVFRGLVRLDTSLEPVPDLAREIEISADGTVYRFVLHEMASFHDGSRIDAAAVVRSFNRASDPALSDGDASTLPAATYFADIQGIDERMSGDSDTISGISAVDAATVEIVLTRPVVSFLSRLTGSPAAIVDTGEAEKPGWWHAPNGSGPFRVNEFIPEERLTLEPYDEYYGGRPMLDAVTVLFGSAALQPLNLYEEGTINVTSVPSWAVDRVLTPTDPLHSDVVETELLSTTFIALNPTVAPFDDLVVRQMIAMALDVDKLVELGFDSRVSRAHGLIPPGISDREWPATLYPYDLPQARARAETVVPLSAPLTIFDPGGGFGSVLKVILQRDLGLELDVIDREWSEFARSLTLRELPAFVLTWVADFPDPDNTLATLLRSRSPDNYLRYANTEFDELVDAAAVEVDDDARRGLYLRAQELAIQDAVVIPLYHEKSYTLVQPRVRGLVVTEIGILSLENVWIEDDLS